MSSFGTAQNFKNKHTNYGVSKRHAAYPPPSNMRTVGVKKRIVLLRTFLRHFVQRTTPIWQIPLLTTETLVQTNGQLELVMWQILGKMMGQNI